MNRDVTRDTLWRKFENDMLLEGKNLDSYNALLANRKISKILDKI